ncbi:hypothetical protein OTU49_000566, partial [Cherax quadricarinatus]
SLTRGLVHIVFVTLHVLFLPNKPHSWHTCLYGLPMQCICGTTLGSHVASSRNGWCTLTTATQPQERLRSSSLSTLIPLPGPPLSFPLFPTTLFPLLPFASPLLLPQEVFAQRKSWGSALTVFVYLLKKKTPIE